MTHGWQSAAAAGVRRARTGPGVRLGVLCAIVCLQVAAVQPAAVFGGAAKDAGEQNLRVEVEPAGEPIGGFQAARLPAQPDARSLLSRAADYAGERQFREAVLLLQHVMDRYGAALLSTDQQVYRPARRVVEQTLRGMPADALRTYRLMFDGEAAALVDGPVRGSRDAAGLRRIVQRHFLASAGDEAALALAALRLDRGDFHGAKVLLHRIVTDYPDPSVPLVEVHSRLALAGARAGDMTAAAPARRWLARHADLSAERLADLRPERPGQTDASPRAVVASATAHGQPGDNGIMSDPIGDLLDPRGEPGTWAAIWEQTHPLRYEQRQWGRYQVNFQNGAGQSRQHLLKRWDQRNWFSAQRMVFDADRVFYKQGDAVAAVNLSDGRRVWHHEPPPTSRGPGRSTRHYTNVDALPERPATVEEVRLFADRISNDLRLIDGVLYHIADHALATRDANHHRRMGGSDAPRLGNRLIAVDADSGEIRWTAGISGEATDPLSAVRFLGPPVAVGQRLAVTVERQGNLLLALLDPGTGEVDGEPIHLCSITSYINPPWYPAAMLAAHGRLYVLAGHGMVFAVAPEARTVQWAARYRPAMPDLSNNRHVAQRLVQKWGRWIGSDKVRGWEHNAMFLAAGKLIVMPWDRPSILTLDPSTGERATDASGEPLEPIELDQPRHAIGVADGRAIVALADRVQAWNLHDGSLAWEANVPAMTGRPVLTGRSVYVPAGRKLIRLALDEAGERRGVARMTTPRGEPLANIYFHKDRVLGLTLDHAYALVEADRWQRRLDARIAESDGVIPRLQRARLLRQRDRFEAAADDLNAALAMAEGEQRGPVADRLWKLSMARAAAEPDRAAHWLEHAGAAADTDDRRMRLRMQRAWLAVRDGRIESAMDDYFAVLAESEQAVPRHGHATDARRIDLADSWGTRQVGLADAARAGVSTLHVRAPHRVEPRVAALADQTWRQVTASLQAARFSFQKRQAIERMGQLAVAYAGTEVAARAVDRLAQYDDRLGLEPVQPALERLGDHRDRSIAARARVALATLYEQHGWGVQAAHAWRDLRGAMPEQTVSWEGRQRSVAALAAEHLAALPAAARDRPLHASGQTPLPPWEKAWEASGYGNGVLDVHHLPASEFLARHVLLVLRNERVIRALPHDATAINDDRKAWDIPIPKQVARSIQPHRDGTRFAGTITGSAILFYAGDTTEAWSLTTGRKLWERPTEEVGPGRDQVQQRHYQHQLNESPAVFQAMDHGERLFVRLRIDRDLTHHVVVRAMDTGRVRWSRAFDRQMVSGVKVQSGYVIIALKETALVCDPRTGDVIASWDMPALNGRGDPIWMGDRLIHPVPGEEELVARRLPDGQVMWRSAVGDSSGNLSSGKLGRLNDEHLFHLSRRTDRLTVLTAATGAVRAHVDTERHEMRTHHRFDPAVTPDGSELFIVGDDRNGNPRLWIFDLNAGELTRTIEFEDRHHVRVPARVLARSGELLPWIVRPRDEDGNRAGRTTLGFYRRSTGERYTDHELPGSPKVRNFRYVRRPPQIRGGSLIVTTSNGVEAFGTRGAPAEVFSAAANTTGRHVVKSGETLFAIAKRYYGDGHRWPRIAKANDGLEPDKLRIGQSLVIPEADEDAATDPDARSADDAAEDGAASDDSDDKSDAAGRADGDAAAIKTKKVEAKLIEIHVPPDAEMAEVMRRIEVFRGEGMRVRIIQQEQP